MLRSLLSRWFYPLCPIRTRTAHRFIPTFTGLETRLTPAVTASFSNGVLRVFGDDFDNTITISRDAAGAIRVNDGAVAIAGGTPTVAGATLMTAFGLGGNDVITLDEANGALPRAILFGGTGDDVLTGGSGSDVLYGQAGNDNLLSRAGNDFLFGGSDNDVLTGGTGNDQVFGEAGDDQMIWNNGDNTDLNEGGAGIDTAEVNGANAGDIFTVAANGTRVRFERTNLVPFTIDIGATENLVVNMLGGDDSFSATGNLATLIALTVDGGAGNDALLGGNGADVLLGGEGNDFIDGNQGSDTSRMGAGDDVFQWDPGDGSDTVEGQDGADIMLFNGNGLNEDFEASANGERVRFTRNVGNVVMDINDIERIDLNALGGADTITVNALAGTDIKELNLNLSAPTGVGDGQEDTVVVNGTKGDDVFLVSGNSKGISVSGLQPLIGIVGAEAGDKLTVNAQAGADVVEASALDAGAIQFAADGGDDNDILIGTNGDDVLLGGEGDDVLIGGLGSDKLDGGAGDNIVIQ